MTDWYFYKIYGINIKINQKIIGLEPCNDFYEDYTIKVVYKNIDNEKTSIKFIDNVYTIYLYKYSIVQIHSDTKFIEWDAQDYCSFMSTFFNIPFSIISLLNDRCLLHVSTLNHNDNLYAFCAKQGIGKSTLCFLLNDEEYKFFSDDTLSVNKDYYGTRGNSIIKLTEETIELTNKVNVILYENINKKKCILLNEHQKSEYPIKYLFFLERTRSNIDVMMIENPVQKKMLLYDHIVGINYFNYDLFKLADTFIESSIIEKIMMFKLFIPDDLDNLEKNALEIKQRIIEVTKEKKWN